jgi:hypothetical protein
MPSVAGTIRAPEPAIDVNVDPEFSSEALSVTDLDFDARPTTELRQKKPTDRPPENPLPVEPAVKGLWVADEDDRSIVLPLTRKKD